MTENHLSITISAEELRQIEAQASPEREKVRQMFEAYRPGLGNGNGDEKRPRTVDVQAEPATKPKLL